MQDARGAERLAVLIVVSSCHERIPVAVAARPETHFNEFAHIYFFGRKYAFDFRGDSADCLIKNIFEIPNQTIRVCQTVSVSLKAKPTPFDEANSLIWYLENVFYEAIGRIASEIKSEFPN